MQTLSRLLIFSLTAVLLVSCTKYSFYTSDPSNKDQEANSRINSFDLIDNKFSESQRKLEFSLTAFGYRKLELKGIEEDEPAYYKLSKDNLILYAAIFPKPVKGKIGLILYQVKDLPGSLNKEEFLELSVQEFIKIEKSYKEEAF